MALNVIEAKFCGGKTYAWTDTCFQWDYGQIMKFDGLTLPEAYEVHFSNVAVGGNSVTQIGGEDGVTIPDQFFTSGNTVYAWVYLHDGEDDGETVYSVTIPIKKRPKPSNETPTPVQQDAITEAIAALNSAVDKAETAITHYPQIVDDYWYIWDVTNGEYVNTNIKAVGDDGTSVTASVSTITGGHRVTLTDADGEHIFDVMDGEDGEDGFSPEISVTDITGGHRITITDANGTQTVDVMDGQQGDAGNGIASITKTGTAGLVDTYTILYTNGNSTTFTVTNGSDATVTVDDALSDSSTNPVQNKVVKGAVDGLKADLNELSSSIAPVESTATATSAHAVGELFMMGETLLVALSAIAVGDTITTEGGSPNAAVTTLSSKLIKDVQINGSSILSNGVANVPIATGSILGTIKASGTRGVSVRSDGDLTIERAQSAAIKAATSGTAPIVAYTQHESTFYGLAKASGDTTQSSSSNAVGVYTETALSKISDMLNAPVSVSGTTPTITAKSGVRYICGECSTLSIVAPESGCIDVVFQSGSTATVLTVTSAKTGITSIKWANGFDDTSLDANTTYEINILDGEFGVVASWT